MGLLDDLQMGFGLKERDDDYYERTAATIGREQGSGAEERYRGSNVFQERPQFGGPLAFFARGGEGGGITGPRDFVDGGGLGRSGDAFVGGPVSILANLLGIRPMGYSDRDRVGQRVGMGAFDSGILRPTQSVTGAVTGVRPNPNNSGGVGLDRFESDDARAIRASLAANVPAPNLSPRSDNTGSIKYAGPKDYSATYNFIDSPYLNYFDPVEDITLESGLTARASGQPSFDEFMVNQRALESELGYPPMDDKYYQDAYQRFLTRTR